jgi:ribosomal protein S4
MLIKSANINVYGKFVNLPGIGEIAVSPEGIVEVDDATGKMIVENSHNRWVTVEETTKKNKKEAKVEETEVETEEETTEEVEEDLSIKGKLEGKTKKELQDIIKGIDLDKTTKDKLIKGTSEKMIKFLLANVEEEDLNSVL